MEKITYINIEQIQPNPLNPRKTIDETTLKELAESVSKVGVLQPITVRATDIGYEIVCGERRWRASKVAGLKEIPTIIRELSDDDAMDITITENLQRQDIAPLEEAEAFQYLIGKKWELTDIMSRFGKSESFIRSRLKLNDLIPKFKDLLSRDVISLSQAVEICKIETDIQEVVHTEHFRDELSPYYHWFDKKPKELAESINNSYSQQISRFTFNTKECKTCPHSSASHSLFGCENETARCFNRECKESKELQHTLESVKRLKKKYPQAEIISLHNEAKDVVALREEGYEVRITNSLWRYEEIPTKPSKDNEEKMAEYEQDLKELQEGINNGTLKYLILIHLDVSLRYCSVESADVITPQTAVEEEVKTLRKKDESNNEIRIENTCRDVKQLLREKGVPASQEQSELEEQIMYYLMINCGDKDLFPNHEGYVNSQDKWNRSCELTAMEKTMVIRKWIHSSLQNYSDFDKKLWATFAEQYFPTEVVEIKDKYQKVYEKRREKINLRIEEVQEVEDEQTENMSEES